MIAMKTASMAIILLTLIPFSRDVALGGYQSFATLEISDRGEEVFLDSALNSSLKQMQIYLENAAPADLRSGALPPECQPEPFAGLSFHDKWTLCPGIPDFLLADGDYIINLNPRPTQSIFKQVKIEHIEFAQAQVECAEQTCAIGIPLKQLKITSQFQIKQLVSSSSWGEGTILSELSPFTIEIKEGLNKKWPQLKIYGRMQPTDEGQSRLAIMHDKSHLSIPTGSIAIHIPERFSGMSLGEVLNDSGKISVNSFKLESILGIGGMFDDELYNLFRLIDIDEPINEHFNNANKIGYVVKLVNDRIFPYLLENINTYIKDSEIFSGKKVPLPQWGMQQMIHQEQIQSILSQYEVHIKQCHQDVREEKPCSENFLFIDKQLPLSEVLQRFTSSPVMRAHQEKIIDIKQQILQLLEHMHESSYDFSETIERTVDEVVHIDRILSQVQHSTGDDPAYLNVQFNLLPLTDHLLIALNEKNFLQSDEGISPRKKRRLDSDFRFYFDLRLLNKILEFFFTQKFFDFCISEDPWGNCQVQRGLATRDISFATAPQILWDKQAHSLYFHLAFQQKVDGVEDNLNSIKVYFKPSNQTDGSVAMEVKTEIEGINHHEVMTFIINKSLHFIAGIHPLLNYFLPQEVLTPETAFADGSYEYQFRIPDWNIAELKAKKNQIFISGQYMKKSN